MRADATGTSASVAEALFQSGVALFGDGRVHEACEKFDASFRLDPANGTLLNLALCHEREKRYASAWADFSLLAGRASQAGQKEREQLARKKAAELEGALTFLRIRFAGLPSDYEEIRVDDQPLARTAWSMPLPLDPGAHAITFSASGKRPATRTVRVGAEPTALVVDAPRLEEIPKPVAVAVAPVPEEPAPREAWHSRQTAGLVTGAAGVLLLGAGGYFGLRTLAKRDEGDTHCDGRLCDAEGIRLHDDAKTNATLSTVTMAAGLAALGVGAYLVFAPTAPAAAATPRAAMRAAPTARVGLSAGGVSIEGAW